MLETVLLCSQSNGLDVSLIPKQAHRCTQNSIGAGMWAPPNSASYTEINHQTNLPDSLAEAAGIVSEPSDFQPLWFYVTVRIGLGSGPRTP